MGFNLLPRLAQMSVLQHGLMASLANKVPVPLLMCHERNFGMWQLIPDKGEA